MFEALLASSRARVTAGWLLALGLLVPGCREDYVPTGTGSGTESTTGDSTSDGSGSGTSNGTTSGGSGTTTEGGCTADNAEDPACPADSPYCVGGSCSPCADLPDGCSALDPGTPACDALGGTCQPCTDSDPGVCGGETPICVDNGCEACVANAQCPSGVCILSTGACQPVNLALEGVINRYELVTATPLEGAHVSIDNIDPAVEFPSTPATGDYTLEPIPVGSLVEVEVDFDEGWVGDSTPAFRTVHQRSLGLTTPVQENFEAVSYTWLAQVALDCGVYNFPANATQWDVLCNPGPDMVAEPGCAGTGEGVGLFFLTRSTIVGTLYDVDGTSLYKGGLSKLAISAVVNAGGTAEANVENNPNDTDANPFHVCWLKESAGELVGSTDDANTSGHFVMFRVRNAQNLGVGQTSVEASGFISDTVNLTSTGAVGVLELQRTTEAIERDFAVDVYPMFTKYGCINCHATGGIGAEMGERAGFKADWSLTPQEVYDNLIGPGTICNLSVPIDDPNWGTDITKSSGRLRICSNKPEDSLVVIRPTGNLPVVAADVHPVDIFPDQDHPALIVFREWVEQGAKPPAVLDPVDFTQDIHPIFTSRGCIACHFDCGMANMGPGCKLDAGTNTFWSDWSLDAQAVFDNLTGPGTDCPDLQNPGRVCVNSPEDSLFVTRPLAGEPPNDPHPAEIFATKDDPDLKLIIRWIEEGAKFAP